MPKLILSGRWTPEYAKRLRAYSAVTIGAIRAHVEQDEKRAPVIQLVP